MMPYYNLFVHLILIFYFYFPMIAARGNKAHNTFIKHTYKDGHALGPQNWAKLPDGVDTTNFCANAGNGPNDDPPGPGTPQSILGSQATLPIREIDEELELDANKPSLTFQVKEGVELISWQFGYPTDIYHGIEIRGPHLGLVQVLDSYEPLRNKTVNYDFNFASITFCDFGNDTASDRSSHELDGRRFPLEINMVFISEPREIGIDNNFQPRNNESIIVMLSILGEVVKKNNALLAPLIAAARKFKGGDFDMDDTDDDFYVNIEPPFSPTWLLPRKSQYYYYHKGTFPVPPCFPLDQVYVFKTPIKISQKQLDVLINLSTEREPDKKFKCNFGLLRTPTTPALVYYNPYEYRVIGTDNRPENSDTDLGLRLKAPYDTIWVFGVFLSYYSL